MLYGWNRWQWWTHQAAPLIRYWKVREFSAVISARRVKNITKLADPEMRKCQKKQRFYFLSCYHEITILLSSKAMLFSKMSHKLRDQRQIFFVVFYFPNFFEVTSWPLVSNPRFGVSSEMHIHWVWFLFRMCWTLPILPPKPYFGLCKSIGSSIGISSGANIQTAVWGLHLLKVQRTLNGWAGITGMERETSVELLKRHTLPALPLSCILEIFSLWVYC